MVVAKVGIRTSLPLMAGSVDQFNYLKRCDHAREFAVVEEYCEVTLSVITISIRVCHFLRIYEDLG